MTTNLALILFLKLSISESFNLNSELFQKISQMKDRPPLFIELWDPFCHNCQSFKPEWEQLTSLKYFDKKIVFGDINCVSEKKLCQVISPGKEYPRFVWIDQDNQRVQHYIGSYSLSDLATWLKSQLQNDALHVVNDSISFDKIKQISIKNPLFRFIVNENDKKSIELISNAVRSVKYYQIKMILSYNNTENEPRLFYYSPDSREIQMKWKFEYQSIINFIKMHALRFFLPYDDMVGQFSFLEKIPIMIFAFPNNSSELRKLSLEAAKSVEESNLLPVSQIDCDYNQYFCRYHGIANSFEKVSVVVINKSQNVFYKCHFNKTEQIPILSKWITGIKLGRIRKLGPGSVNSFVGSILNNYLEFRGLGGWKYYIFFVPFIVIIFAFFFIIAFICYVKNEKRQCNHSAKQKHE